MKYKGTKKVIERQNYEPESWALYCNVIDAKPEETERIVVVDDEKGLRLQPYGA